MTEAEDKLARLARGQLAEANNAKLPKRVRRIHAKQLARVEFVQDPGQRSALVIWRRADRPYRELWTAEAFTKMVRQLAWQDEREAFWEDVHHFVSQEATRQAAQALLSETAAMKSGVDALLEYFQPLRDASGEVRRHDAMIQTAEGEVPNPFEGLPVFPLELRSFDQTATAMIKFYERMLANRNIIEGTHGPRGVGGRNEDGSDSDDSDGPMPSSDAIAEIARQLVAQGQATMDDFDSTALPADEAGSEYEDLDDGFGDVGDEKEKGAL